MSDLLNLSSKNFNETVLNAELPILVDFWASWCPPCKMIEPVLNDLSCEEKDRFKFAKINVDQNRNIAASYNIGGVPTFILFNAGKEVSRRSGAQSKGQLKQMLEELR